MKVHLLAVAVFTLAPLLTGCKPAELDSGFVAAHETIAEAECCRASAYASATGSSGEVADEMNAAAEICYASLGGMEGASDHLQRALPSGYEFEHEYMSKLSDSDRSKVESIQQRGHDCSARANKTWETKTMGGT